MDLSSNSLSNVSQSMESSIKNGKEILNDTSTFVMNVAQFYNQSLLSDVQLKVGERTFYGHKFVLAKSSDVFRTMLYAEHWCSQQEATPTSSSKSGATSGCAPEVVQLELNETPECQLVFDLFLRYLYTAEVEIRCSSAVGILCLADKYNVESLKTLTFDYMTRNSRSPRIHNALHWYAWAKMLNLHNLEEQCFKTINWNLEAVIRSPDWYELDREFLVDILSSSSIVVANEQMVLDAVIEWLLHDKHKDQLSENVARLLPLIRFPMMYVDQLYRVEMMNLFTDNVEAALLLKGLINQAYRFRALCPDQHNLLISFADDFFQPRDYRSMQVDTVRIGNTMRFGFQVDARMFVGPVPKEVHEGDWKVTYKKNGEVWSVQIYCHESAMVNSEARIQVTILVQNEDGQIIHVVRGHPHVCTRGTPQNLQFDLTEYLLDARNLCILLKPIAN